MFIDKININNYKLFSSDDGFAIEASNIPDGVTEGSGLNVFVGENGGGKSALLEAISLPLLEYKAEGISIGDFNDLEASVDIKLYSAEEFEVDGTMPKGSFMAKGFEFEAGIRSRGSKSYLSSMVVNDQRFIGVDPKKPKQGSPDLRVKVNNPFKGRRFAENDILFLDKNRLFQTRTGNFNATRFDRLMEDFSYQYVKDGNLDDLNVELDEKVKKNKVKNKFLTEAVSKFEELSGSHVRLNFLRNFEPFKAAFFAEVKDNNQQVLLNDLGSGYEMVFALLYSFYLARQSGKQLIVLIDEPELHLHPALQEKFVEFLLEASKEAQVFITSHSPLLVKQLTYNDEVNIRIIDDGKQVVELDERVLRYVSANETNYLAFNLATEEYHNELYEELKDLYGATSTIKNFDKEFFVTTKGEPQDSPWKGNPDEVSVHTFIRNQIHHRKDNGVAAYPTLKASIARMRNCF